VTRVALISDIHGNAVALDAVLADIARRRVDEVVCLGDVAMGAPQPREVLARLRDLSCAVVMGDADEWLLEGLATSPPTRTLPAWPRSSPSTPTPTSRAAPRVADGVAQLAFLIHPDRAPDPSLPYIELLPAAVGAPESV
jgi:hypothetical protein